MIFIIYSVEIKHASLIIININTRCWWFKTINKCLSESLNFLELGTKIDRIFFESWITSPPPPTNEVTEVGRKQCPVYDLWFGMFENLATLLEIFPMVFIPTSWFAHVNKVAEVGRKQCPVYDFWFGMFENVATLLGSFPMVFIPTSWFVHIPLE